MYNCMMQSVIVRSALTYFIEAAKGGGVKEEEQQQACKQFRNGQTTCKPEGKCSQKTLFDCTDWAKILKNVTKTSRSSSPC